MEKEITNTGKRILVAGGAGFIGSNLCKILVEEGNQVICVDNLSSGSKEKISPLLKYDNFSFHELDIVDKLPDYLYRVDEIYNLACPASPPNYQRDAIHTTLTSVVGTLNLLMLAKETGAKFLQASTSEVYGNPKVHPQTEAYWGNVNPIGIRSCYDEGKRCAETLIMDFHRQYDVDVKIVRIFNTYGPRMEPDDGRVVSNFIVQALTGQDITIYGDGSQTRSFQYIDDLLEGMTRLMSMPKNVTGPVNIGNPHEITVKELAEIILSKVISDSTIVYRPLPSDDPVRRKPNIDLAKNILGWEPVVSVDKGLDETIAYFRALLTRKEII